MRVFLIAAILACALAPEAGWSHSTLDGLHATVPWQIREADAAAPAAWSYIGLKLADLDANRAAVLKLSEERGVEVKGVVEGSPADAAKLESGDVLLTYNGENILGARQLVRLVRETPPGRKVKIQFWRDGKTHSTIVTTGSRSAESTPIVGFSLSQRSFYSGPVDVPRPVMVWRNLLLGIEFEQVDSQFAEYFGVPEGVLIRGVEKDSPAEKSGLKTGDVIFSVGHKDLSTAHDITSGFRQPGASVSVSLIRNHKKLDLMLTLPASQ